MRKTHLHLVVSSEVDVTPADALDGRALSLKVDPVIAVPPLTLDLSSWGVPPAGPQAQPAIDAGGTADWWNAPTYTTDLIPPFRGVVTVTASSGEGAPRAEIGPLGRLPLNMGDPLAHVDGGASAGLLAVPGAYPRGAVEVMDAKQDSD